jgi:hypothetical protein
MARKHRKKVHCQSNSNKYKLTLKISLATELRKISKKIRTGLERALGYYLTTYF